MVTGSDKGDVSVVASGTESLVAGMIDSFVAVSEGEAPLDASVGGISVDDALGSAEPFDEQAARASATINVHVLRPHSSIAQR